MSLATTKLPDKKEFVEALKKFLGDEELYDSIHMYFLQYAKEELDGATILAKFLLALGQALRKKEIGVEKTLELIRTIDQLLRELITDEVVLADALGLTNVAQVAVEE